MAYSEHLFFLPFYAQPGEGLQVKWWRRIGTVPTAAVLFMVSYSPRVLHTLVFFRRVAVIESWALFLGFLTRAELDTWGQLSDLNHQSMETHRVPL